MNFIKHLKVLYNTFLERSNETHKSIIQALIIKMADMESDVGLMLAELCILTATGTWLDEWGSWFGVLRRKNETDSDYSERIIISIKSPKSTIPALKEHSVNFLNYKYNNGYCDRYTVDDIVIFEPWTKLSMFSHRGLLSGTHRFPDGEYWRRNVIDISIPEDITKEFIDMINHIKAAGIQVSYTTSPFRGEIITGYNPFDNNRTDTSIETNQYLYRTGEGVLLSVLQPPQKALSGKRDIWGIDHLIDYDMGTIFMFRNWCLSYLFSKSTLLEVPIKKYIDLGYIPWDWHSHTKTVMDALEKFRYLNIAHICSCTVSFMDAPEILSSEYGLLSSIPGQKSILITDANELTRWGKRFIMPAVQRELLFLSPHIMSVQSRLSNNVTLSGAFEDSGLYKCHHDIVDVIFSEADSLNIGVNEYTIITETAFRSRQSEFLSGKQCLWSDDTSSLNLTVKDTLNWHSPIITVTDVLALYENTTVEDACKGLYYSYPFACS